ncbi:MAG: membrane protein insertase YidC [Candidatus Ochrobactrum gambitense]|nr:MAG: membrane protein insertase YidC [Candidatus Ochrobactrum gambitense]
MENKRNFFITIALSILILTLWQVFYLGPKTEAQREQARIEEQQRQAQQAAQTSQAGNGAGDTPQTPAASGTIPGHGDVAAAGGALTREAAIAQTQRVQIDTPSLRGSINLTGARLDDLFLKNYHETVDDNSPNIELLAPSPLKQGYFVELGFTGNDTTGPVPGPNTVWSVEGNDKLTQTTPVTLTYTNEKNITFKRVISVDDAYMFSVDDTITNNTGAPISLASYGRVTRFNQPEHASATYVLHEGLIGVMGQDGLQEIKYSKVEDDKDISFKDVMGGWLGITDKYWAATLVPPQDEKFTGRFSHFTNDRPRYQTDFLGAPMTIEAGQSQTLKNHVFAGAKVVTQIQAYEKQLGIKQFELLIDWGWFYFITKPMFYLIDWIYQVLRQFRRRHSGCHRSAEGPVLPARQQVVQVDGAHEAGAAEMRKSAKNTADDKMKQQQDMMQLYKEEKINPLAGCWPVLVQIPVFFALYKVLYVTIEMRHAPFFGWIQDLAAPDPTSLFNLFGLLPFAVPHFLMIGVWPLIMGITMFLQMRMNPTPPDPTQAAIFTWMPIIFTFMLAAFPAGLVIYWAWNNLLSITQQGIIMKRQGVKIELFDNLKSLFKRKPNEAKK